MLTSGKRLSFPVTECRRIFSAGWRKKFFLEYGTKKGAKTPFFGSLRLAGACFRPYWGGCITILFGAFKVA
jgi:hypothetical protein